MNQIHTILTKTKLSHVGKPGHWLMAFAAIALLLFAGYNTTFAKPQNDLPASSFNSPLPGPHENEHHGDNGRHELLDSLVDRDQVVADALGITVEELDSAKEAGTRLDELVEELGLDQETIRQAIQDGIEDAVEQAVEEGVITEEVATALLNPPARKERQSQDERGEDAEQSDRARNDSNSSNHRHHATSEDTTSDETTSEETTSEETTDDSTTEEATVDNSTSSDSTTIENSAAAEEDTNNTESNTRPSREQARPTGNDRPNGNRRSGR